MTKQREYRVRILSAEERAAYKYVDIKPAWFQDLYGQLQDRLITDL
jgi:hypothetical protein